MRENSEPGFSRPTCQTLKFAPSSRTLKDEETGHKVTVRQEDHAPAGLHPT